MELPMAGVATPDPVFASVAAGLGAGLGAVGIGAHSSSPVPAAGATATGVGAVGRRATVGPSWACDGNPANGDSAGPEGAPPRRQSTAATASDSSKINGDR